MIIVKNFLFFGDFSLKKKYFCLPGFNESVYIRNAGK